MSWKGLTIALKGGNVLYWVTLIRGCEWLALSCVLRAFSLKLPAPSCKLFAAVQRSPLLIQCTDFDNARALRLSNPGLFNRETPAQGRGSIAYNTTRCLYFTIFDAHNAIRFNHEKHINPLTDLAFFLSVFLAVRLHV